MKGDDSLSLQLAKDALAPFHAAERIQLLTERTATVEEAAQALGCAPERIAKTLSFFIEERPIVIVVAGDAKIDNKAFKQLFEVKARMMPASDVERVIGHAIGGVCPFGVRDEVTVYLDESLKRFETVFPACGTANSAIEVTIDELQTFCDHPAWVNVCKNWQSEQHIQTHASI